MAQLDILLLGPPEVRYDGRALSFRSAKALALLTYLAVEGDRRPRETLAALFWPESDTSRARANLRNTLNYLRDALPRTADGHTLHLVIERHALAFDAACAHSLDVAEVKKAAAARRPELLQDALALYRGDFLAGFYLGDAPAFDDWAAFQRQHLRRTLSTVFRRLAHYQAQNRPLPAAMETTAEWLDHDPLSEAAHRQMMELLARDGSRHEALAQYERCRRLLLEELGVEPDARTVALAAQIRDAQGATPPAGAAALSPGHNLPLPDTPFIGREQERALLRQLLDDADTRLVTLCGPGGIGKTRLALQAARESVGRFLDGVWMVSLEEAASVEEMVTALAGAVGLHVAGPADAATQLLAELRKRDLLLVLDNFEQLMPRGVPFLSDLLRQAPGVTLLVTSRERLNLRPERVLTLDGLPLDAARDLFTAAARRADAAFAAEADGKAAIDNICQLVGGLPLGLEMAAAWVRALSPAAIAAELQGNLDLLAKSTRDAPDRHHSLRAVFDASWKRLQRAEKATLRALSIFHGGFTLAAARSVAGAGLPALADLVDKSLLGRQGRDRFAMHPLFHDYVAEKLRRRAGEGKAAATRHSVHYLTWLGEREPALLRGEESDETVLRQIEADIDNVRAAWKTAVRQGRAQLLGEGVLPLGLYYDLRGRPSEWRSLLEPALALLDTGATLSPAQEDALGRLLTFQGLLLSRMGRQQEACAVLRRARPKLSASPGVLGVALNTLAIATFQLEQVAESRALAEEALAHNQASDNPWGAAVSSNVLGVTVGAAGERAQARDILERAVAQNRAVASRHGEARALIHLGHVTHALSNPELARERLQAALALGEQINDHTFRPLALGHLGIVNYGQGRLGAARRHFESALEESMTRKLLPFALYGIGGLGLVAAAEHDFATAVTLLTFFMHQPQALKEMLLGEGKRALAAAAAELAPAAAAAARARGEALTLDEAIALVKER